MFNVIDDKILIELQMQTPDNDIIQLNTDYDLENRHGEVRCIGEDVRLVKEGDVLFVPLQIGAYVTIAGKQFVILTQDEVESQSYKIIK